MKPVGTLLIIIGISLAVPADLYAFTTASVEVCTINYYDIVVVVVVRIINKLRAILRR